MKWSWKIGTLAGIELRMHATFVLLLGWVGAAHRMAGKSADAVLKLPVIMQIASSNHLPR